MTLRDFTETTEARIQEDIRAAEAEGEGLWGWVAAAADFFEDGLLNQDVHYYKDYITQYHHSIVDIYNTTSSELTAIFDEVDRIDAEFRARMQTHLEELTALQGDFALLSEMLNPNPGEDGKEQMWFFRSPADFMEHILSSAETEQEYDKMMKDMLQELLETGRFSKDAWNACTTLEEREQFLRDLFERARIVLGLPEGTRVSFDPNDFPEIQKYYPWKFDDVNGFYDHATGQIYINPETLFGERSEDRRNTVIHESRHAYQHDVVDNPGEHTIVSEETRNQWENNFKPENYRDGRQDPWETKQGIVDNNEDEYYDQPVEWDAFNFAGQEDRVRDVIDPDYAGSW